eukprot:403353-Amphidinium_carterae.1
MQIARSKFFDISTTANQCKPGLKRKKRKENVRTNFASTRWILDVTCIRTMTTNARKPRGTKMNTTMEITIIAICSDDSQHTTDW